MVQYHDAWLLCEFCSSELRSSCLYHKLFPHCAIFPSLEKTLSKKAEPSKPSVNFRELCPCHGQGGVFVSCLCWPLPGLKYLPKVVSPHRNEATLLYIKKGHTDGEEIGGLRLCLSPMGGFVYGLRWLCPQDIDGKVWSMQPRVSAESPPFRLFFFFLKQWLLFSMLLFFTFPEWNTRFLFK